MTTFSLTEIEKKAYRSTFQDGIWDIFLGLSLLVLAAGALLSNSGASQRLTMTILVVLEAAVLLAFVAGKKRITVPRMGFVELGPKRRRRITKSRIVLLGSVGAGVVVFLAALLIRGYAASQPKLGLFLPAAWVANAVIVFALLAYYLDCTRLYAYGVLFALPAPFDMIVKEFVRVNLSPIAFTVPAIVMLIVGTGLLVRFLRGCPLPAKEVSDVS